MYDWTSAEAISLDISLYSEQSDAHRLSDCWSMLLQINHMHQIKTSSALSSSLLPQLTIYMTARLEITVLTFHKLWNCGALRDGM